MKIDKVSLVAGCPISMQFGKPMKNADYGDNVETETGSKIPIWRQLVKQKFYKAVQHVAKMAPA